MPGGRGMGLMESFGLFLLALAIFILILNVGFAVLRIEKLLAKIAEKK